MFTKERDTSWFPQTLGRSAKAGYPRYKVGANAICSWLFCQLGSCSTGPAPGVQAVEMCGDKSPLTETVSLMSRIKNANGGLNCGVIKPTEQLPQTGAPMPCLWCWVLFMSKQLSCLGLAKWGSLLHYLPPSQGCGGPNEGGSAVP